MKLTFIFMSIFKDENVSKIMIVNILQNMYWNNYKKDRRT